MKNVNKEKSKYKSNVESCATNATFATSKKYNSLLDRLRGVSTAKIASIDHVSATKTENPTQDIGQDVSEFKLKEIQGTEREKIDFKDMKLFEICADPELTKKFLQHCPIDPAKMREDVSCPKLINGYRSKRDCLKCSGDKHCIMPILGNPFSEVQSCA